jgi:peroxiredoxin
MSAILLLIASAAPPPPSPAAAAYARIRAEHLEREAALLKALEEAQRALGALEDRLTERHLALARKYPDDPGTYPALEQLLLDATPHAAFALDLITRHHLGSSRLGRLCLFLVEADDGSKTEALVRAAYARSPHAEVRGQAGLALARLLAPRPAAREEAVKALQAVVGKYGKLRMPRIGEDEEGELLAEAAGPLLFDLSRLAVGMKIPEVEGMALDGKRIKLSSSRGKALLLVFWSPVPPGQELFARVEGLKKKHAGRLEVVGVMDDELEAPPAVKPSWRSFRDGSALAASWNVRSWPALFLADADGVIRRRWPSAPEPGELEKALAEVIGKTEK